MSLQTAYISREDALALKINAMHSDKSRDKSTQQITVLDSCWSVMCKKTVTKKPLPYMHV